MTAELSTREDLADLQYMDPAAREMAVTRYLEAARDKLTLAVNLSGPEAVAAIKAEIATAAEATKQLGLSKEIRDDALEMVRRAEYALGKAIRAGQSAGSIETVQEARRRAVLQREVNLGRADQTVISEMIKTRPTDLATDDELSGNGAGIYHLVDGVTDAQFEGAISDAREEGNLSRANVVRKIKGVKQDGPTPIERLVKIRELAPRGYTSGQIAAEIGVTEGYVRDRAREQGIEITADKVMAGTHRVRVDHNHIVNHLVVTLEGLTDGIARVDLDALDDAQMQNWADSLTRTTRALNRFAKQIKEKTQ